MIILSSNLSNYNKIKVKFILNLQVLNLDKNNFNNKIMEINKMEINPKKKKFSNAKFVLWN